MRKINSKIVISLILTFVVLISAFGVGCVYAPSLFDKDDTPNSDNQTSAIRELSASLQLLENKGIITQTVENTGELYTVADVAQKVSDSIVNINVETSSGASAGSGILFALDDTKYYVMTNNHVIEGGISVKCELTDGTVKNATVVASDESTDVGVITIPKIGIDSTKYKTVTIPSDSYEVRVGDTAIAIGNSLGALGGTVTSGIVSALDRQVTVEGFTMNLMQTDAAINQGNSGGGLFDAYGQLIGVVNAKMMSTGIEGLGFAIPVKTAVATACDLIINGYVSGKPMIGVMIREVNSRVKREEFLNTLEGEELTKWQGYFSASNNALGLYVAEVTNVASGLKEGDYVVSFAGKSVITQDDLSSLLSKQRAGDVVSIVVKRNGIIISLNVELLERTSA